jgi:hypothetical protein
VSAFRLRTPTIARKANTMTKTSLASLDRTFRTADAAWDSAITQRDAANLSKLRRLVDAAHAALYDAVPKTSEDVVIVLRLVIGGLRASGDPLADPLVTCLRRLRIKISRRRTPTSLADVIELREAAAAADAVCDGGGKMPWLAQWLRECAAALGRPRLV